MKRSVATNRFLLAGVLNCWLVLSTCAAETVETNTPGIAPNPPGNGTNTMEIGTNAPANGTNAPEAEVKAEETVSAAEVLSAYQKVQEQLQEARLSIERARLDAEVAAARNAEAWSNRLEFVEQSLTAQRDREFETMQKSNKTILTAAGILAGFGFLAMVLTSWLQWRATNRLSELATSQQMTRALLPPGWTMPVLGGTDAHSTGEAAASGTRLLDAIGHLEKLVLALERTAAPPLKDASTVAQQPDSSAGKTAVSGTDDGTPADSAARITLLLGKGQSLLNLDEPDKAEVCFNEVLDLDANNTEALLKKGVALERQRKLSEAIECYDRAIATDSSITIAYLYKGGIYNRMERFTEALECYEKALHSQEGRRSS